VLLGEWQCWTPSPAAYSPRWLVKRNLTLTERLAGLAALASAGGDGALPRLLVPCTGVGEARVNADSNISSSDSLLGVFLK
jgi:hypothetical protein